jgi:anti-anti-sigma factor
MGMPGSLEITQRHDSGVVTIAVCGDLDHVTGEPLSELLETTQQAGTGEVVLDLRGLDFMDSTGLGIMLSAHKRAEELGRPLTIVPGRAAKHVIDATGLSDRLHVGTAGDDLDRRFPASTEAVAESRRAFDAAFPELDSDIRDDARIIVSELVTNGIRHGATEQDGWVRLVVRRQDNLLRIEVSDSNGSETQPHIPERDPNRTSGWGLMLVERLATRWGVSTTGVTTVWCEVAVA